MSDLWLDTELTSEVLNWIASAVRDSGLDRHELEVVFRDELAPFLDPNLRCIAGEWAVFNGDWVCQQAQKLHDKLRAQDGLPSSLGSTAGIPRPMWNRVLAIAFDD